MKNDAELLESLIAGGVIGAALAALIKNNKESATLGAIAGAAILASYHAVERAKKTNIPLVIEEKGALYEIRKDGSKTFIKQIPPNRTLIKKEFSLR
jgi:hypothetical protein